MSKDKWLFGNTGKKIIQGNIFADNIYGIHSNRVIYEGIQSILTIMNV